MSAQKHFSAGFWAELERFVEASTTGDLDFSFESGKLPPEEQEVAHLFNRALSNFRAATETGRKLIEAQIDEKTSGYETVLDAIPFPISVTDKDMNWTFINKAMENLMAVNRGDMMGQPCSKMNSGICNTDACGIAGAKRGLKRAFFTHNNLSFQIDVGILKNSENEPTGYLEMVQDITKMEEMAWRQADIANEVKSVFLATISPDDHKPRKDRLNREILRKLSVACDE